MQSLLVPGAGFYFAGQRRRGIAWFLFIAFMPLAIVGLAGVAAVPAWVVCALIVLVALGWLAMLVDSARPSAPTPWFVWVGLLLLALALRLAGEYALLAVVRTYRTPSAAMAPTIVAGDCTIAVRWCYWFDSPSRGDVVAFNTSAIHSSHWLPVENQIYAKRVIATAGDTLTVHDGSIRVNGEVAASPQGGLSYTPHARAAFLNREGARFIVPSGELFLMGDNTENSLDSRFFGSVPAAGVIAKITIVYWPLSRIRRIDRE